MDVPSTIFRALDAFQGDVENGLIEDADVADIEAARAWMSQLSFAWDTPDGEPETRLDEKLPYVAGRYQRYSDPTARARMAANRCPECGEPTESHGGLGGARCTLTDNGVATRIWQYEQDQEAQGPGSPGS